MLSGAFARQSEAEAHEENVVKAIVLRSASEPMLTAPSGNSLDDAQMPYLGDSWVKPRFTPYYWMALIEHNTRLKVCVEEGARASVGLGAEAVPLDYLKPSLARRRNLRIRVQTDLDALNIFIRRPNQDIEPLWEVLYKVEYDRLGSGNGFIEVVEDERQAGQRVVSLYHVPCVGVRVNRNRDRYVRILNANGTKVFFRRFGDADPTHAFIDRETGEFYTAWPSKLPESRKGTAIHHMKNYCPLDDYYGQPVVVSAVSCVVGNRLIAIWNINFVNNNAHVPCAVIVEGGNLSAEAKEHLQIFLNRDAKGVSNAGRIIILEPDMNSMGLKGEVKIKIEPLKMGISDDASFQEYRDANNMEVQEAFGYADVMIGGGGGTNATTRNAATLRQISQEHRIDPVTVSYECVLGVICTRVGNGQAKVQIHRASNMDNLQVAGVVGKLKDALTVNDVRRIGAKLLQDKELVDVDELGDVPIVMFPGILRQPLAVPALPETSTPPKVYLPEPMTPEQIAVLPIPANLMAA